MSGDPLAIYIHWPFCLARCPYCDFNSHVRDRVDDQAWSDALVAAFERQAETIARRPVDSIFFGGGTPSLMPPALVARLIDRIAQTFDLCADAEITLEANPTSVEASRFTDFRAAGINRVSIGVQALDDQALRFLGRRHDCSEALAAIALAARVFARFSFDLIYARPGQSPAAWDAELARALDHAGGHLSLYQLTIEAGTAFHTAYARGDFALPDDDHAAALYELTETRMGAAGYAAYEVSNYALPGDESRHNLAYWHYRDYLGVGPGAHGRVTGGDGVKRATRQHKVPETWLQAVAGGADGMVESLPLTAQERLEELLMMGLRLTTPIARARIEQEAERPFDRVFDAATLATLIDGGFLVDDAAGLAATPAGRLRLNAVLGRLLAPGGAPAAWGRLTAQGACGLTAAIVTKPVRNSMAETMRGFAFTKFDFASLEAIERPVPRPGPHEVLVRMRAVSANFRDVSIALGYYNPRQKLPFVPLSDAVGEVVGNGTGATRFKVGERVCPAFFQAAWMSGRAHPRIGDHTLGSPADGVLVQYRVFHEDALVRPPTHLSDPEAATLACAGVTAWQAMFHLGGLQPGQTLLVQGTGGVAMFGLVLAKIAGLRAIVVSSSDDKLKRAATIGATDLINYKTNPDWEQEVLAVTHGTGADCILDIGGADTMMRSVQAAAYGGTIVTIGFLGGMMPELSVIHLLMKQLRIQGVTVGPRDAFEAMCAAFERSGARPVVDQVLAFEDAPKLLPLMKSAQHFGKLGLAVD